MRKCAITNLYCRTSSILCCVSGFGVDVQRIGSDVGVCVCVCVGGGACWRYMCVNVLHSLALAGGCAAAIINGGLMLHLDFNTLKLPTPIRLSR